MKVLLFFFVALALGSANRVYLPIGPTTIFGPSREDRIKTAIDKNVQWLLSGIRNGTLEGPDLPRAVVALFLAKPGLFSPGHEVRQELKEKIETALTELIRQGQIQAKDHPRRRFFIYERKTALSFIPSEELALYLQALLVSCVDPYDFLGYDLTEELYKSVLRHHCDHGICTFPSSAMLALCNARAASKEEVRNFFIEGFFNKAGISSSMRLKNEEAFRTMTFGCLESSNYPYPNDIPWDMTLRYNIGSDYPSNLTVEDFQEMMKPSDDDTLRNTTSLFDIAAAMQNLMYNHRLRVSDLPLGVDFLLKNQEEDGSWGQSALNSFFVLPVLSNKSFLDITSDHCPAESVIDGEMSENESLEDKMMMYILLNRTLWYSFLPRSATLYSALSGLSSDRKVIIHNGTDGKPYLHSFGDLENHPETGYFWFTYEQTRWPKESFTLLTQSLADIKIKLSSRYLLWYRRKTEEALNDQNEIDAVTQTES